MSRLHLRQRLSHTSIAPREKERVTSRYLRDGGFTIVELIIAIIVIAILALIVITTYNGVQTKAKNAKTVATVETWVKALNLYNLDNDSWPTPSCLGDSAAYDGGHCWRDAWWTVVSPSFLSLMRPYVGSNPPTPDLTDIDPSNGPKRGAFFFTSTTGLPTIYFMQVGSGPCPHIGGLSFIASQVTSGGIVCMERITQ